MRRHLYLPYQKWRVINRELYERGAAQSLTSQLKAAWVNAWFTMACRLQARTHQGRESCVDPVFICGFWRSGTTYLHTLLASDVRFNYPRTDQCMNPARLALPITRHDAAIRRPMDDVLVRADSPQEDEFALLSLGIPSFYEVLLLPTSWRSHLRQLDHLCWPPEDLRFWSHGFKSFLTLLGVNDVRRPLLKSPTHSFRMDLLAELFPQAKFVFLTRDPATNYLSNIKLWSSMFDLYALEQYNKQELPDLICSSYHLMVERTVTASKRLHRGQIAYINYETLIADPMNAVKAIYAELHLSWNEECERAVNECIDSRENYMPNHYAVSDTAKHDAAIQRLSFDYQRLLVALTPFAINEAKGTVL